MRKGRVLLLSLVVPVVFLVVGLATRNDWGETWDESLGLFAVFWFEYRLLGLVPDSSRHSALC